MRQDMSKVVTECYRSRSGIQNPDTKNNRRHRNQGDQMEDAPFRDRMRPHHGKFIDRREFGENLSPLYRFLNSRVGRHWDSVYSEISEHLNRSSTTHRHIFQHLWDHVVQNVVIRDGKLGELDRFGFYHLRNNTLYIDPVTSVFKKFHAPPKQKKQPSILHVRKKGRFFRKSEGDWMELKFLPIPPLVEIEPNIWEGGTAQDLIYGPLSRNVRSWRWPWYRDFRLTNMYCSEILPLTPTQKKHLGLKND